MGVLTAPFFSVILPTYNREHLITRAVASVLAQTFHDFELIVVDDASQDNTAEIVSGLCADDARLRLIQSMHVGAPAARNVGIASAAGEFVAFIDSDDEYLTEHLAIRAEYLQQHPNVQMLHGGVDIIGDPFVPDANDPEARIHIKDCVVGGTFVISKKVLSDVGGFPDVSFGEDLRLYQLLVQHAVVVDHIDAATYRYYRNTADSTCNVVGAATVLR